MKRSWIAVGVMVLGWLVLVACSGQAPSASEPNGSAASQAPGPGGRIAFMRGDPSEGVLAGEGVTYTIEPDGSAQRQLFSDGPSAGPRWSPDGTEIQLFCCDDGMAAHLVDPETGDIRASFPPPDPTVETFCGLWSPDGKRLACEGHGVDDPNLNGIYSVRVSDGGGLARITTIPGGVDIPGDYSPEGEQLVFVRTAKDGDVGVFVTAIDGKNVRRISPPGVVVDEFFGGSWSPNGDRILFVARDTEEHHKAIWVVDADGSNPHPFPITPECGGEVSDPGSFGCYSPSWSPDGTQIVFTRSSPDGSEENLWIVNVDGSGLVQLTDGGTDDQPDWGPDPAA